MNAMVNFIKKGVICICLGGLALSSLNAFCALTQTVKIKVAIQQATCVVNNNQIIRVNFGNEILAKNINGSNYLQPIDYTLSCSGSNADLRLRMSGTAAEFNSDYLQTSMDNLGIAIYADNAPLKNGAWLNFKRTDLPVLSAAPVKADNAELTGGKFSASAVLQIEYQ